MPLTDTAIRSAKPREKPYKLADERGLYLLVHPNGGRYWRFKFHYAGKEKLLALGAYPDVSLKDARAKRDVARQQVAADSILVSTRRPSRRRGPRARKTALRCSRGSGSPSMR